MRQKRREASRSEERRPVEGRSAAPRNRRSGDRSQRVSLASVSAWLRPTFLLAGERPLRFFAPRLSVSFRRRPLPSRRVSSRVDSRRRLETRHSLSVVSRNSSTNPKQFFYEITLLRQVGILFSQFVLCKKYFQLMSVNLCYLFGE